MCGVAAIHAFGSHAPPVDAGELAAVTGSIAARRPDGAGAWISDDGRVGLGHWRLAIRDLSDAGAQPMTGVCQARTLQESAPQLDRAFAGGAS